jgi:hypothetical protein
MSALEVGEMLTRVKYRQLNGQMELVPPMGNSLPIISSAHRKAHSSHDPQCDLVLDDILTMDTLRFALSVIPQREFKPSLCFCA